MVEEVAVLSRRQCLEIGALIGGVTATRGMTAIAEAGMTARTSQAADRDTLGFRSAAELARMIRDGDISSLELTRYFIERIERFDPTLNAVVVRGFDRALDAAKRADEALMKGHTLGPLHGLPMTIKESFDIQGLPSTFGIPALADNIARQDADLVKRFKAAGAHFMGKTNVPLALADYQSYNDIYGVTRNPWDPTRTPGGSSGGSAATLAAGMTGLDSGSDIGGSLRNPAHYCGVYGHKPTWQVVSSEGQALPGSYAAPDLAVVGPMARSAEDLALAMELVAGPGALDAPGWHLKLPPPRAKSLSEFRVAIWATDTLAPPSRAVSGRIQAVADTLVAAGAHVSYSARPSVDVRESHYTYITLLESFLGALMPPADFASAREYAAGFTADDESEGALRARAKVLDHRNWIHAHDVRTRIRAQWKAFFEEWDIVIAPIMVTTAFKHDHSPEDGRTLMVDGKEVPYREQAFWAGLATVSFLPSTVFPAGLADDGLPVGVQAIGAEYNDRTTIEFARLVAEALGGYQPPPGFGD